uniref:Uncharacterized protein n=1 Tax=Spongospora subterranea TaxID=70186 RepID=A0A0H5QT24_9EUKA|eukprot:CRZ05173.1 hypothetical protein [Spongospora subterranea]
MRFRLSLTHENEVDGVIRSHLHFVDQLAADLLSLAGLVSCPTDLGALWQLVVPPSLASVLNGISPSKICADGDAPLNIYSHHTLCNMMLFFHRTKGNVCWNVTIDREAILLIPSVGPLSFMVCCKTLPSGILEHFGLDHFEHAVPVLIAETMTIHRRLQCHWSCGLTSWEKESILEPFSPETVGMIARG